MLIHFIIPIFFRLVKTANINAKNLTVYHTVKGVLVTRLKQQILFCFDRRVWPWGSIANVQAPLQATHLQNLT